jgi:sugar transferase (PEP-CTERM/EpsH1 system associated)
MAGPVTPLIHVVHVLHSLGVGGTENGVVNLINALGGEFRHTIVSMSTRGALAARLSVPVEIHALDRRRGLDLRASARLARLLRRLRPDVVHSRNWGAFDAILAARLAHVPTLIHGEHGWEASDPAGRNPRRNRFRRLLAPLVWRFITVSRDLERWLTTTVGVPADKIVTIVNGVDTARFAEAPRDAGRRALGLGEDRVVIGTVGRLNPVKDQGTLLDAFARVPDGRRELALVLVGEGPAAGALRDRAERPDLDGRVHFLGRRDDIPLVLRGLDVFALPSLNEGISNTVLEAMASGLPIVATRTGGNPELIEDGVTGRLVPVGDAAALAQALGTYARDPLLRTLHGKAARERAVEEFGLDRMVDRYRRLYLEAGARSGRQ